MSDFVHVKVPGTTANCGPGFDVLGIACSIYNELSLKLLTEKRLKIEINGDGAKNIPCDERNMVWQSIQLFLKRTGLDKQYVGAHIKMVNNVPLSRGLGSSATAIVAGLFAANVFVGNKLSMQELFELATELEGHPDNVAPALFGGITVSANVGNKVEYVSFMPSFALKLVVAIPDFYLSTKKARAVLKQEVSMKDAIFNIGHASLIVAALCQGKVEALKGVFEDRLHQPYRATLIPGMYDVFKAANQEGALGTTISGAGPTLIAYALTNTEAIGKAMVKAFANNNIEAKYLVLEIDNKGAHIA